MHNLTAHLLDLEQQLLTPEVRRDPEAVASLLTEDFREFGSSGRIFSRAEVIAELSAEPHYVITLDRFQCTPIGAELALITYRSIRHSATGDVFANRSSLWIYRGSRWQMIFHQGTRSGRS